MLLAHDRRRIVHVAVTEHPTAAWTVQQFRNAFPWDELPRYLLRDRDHAFDHVKTIGIQEVLTAPGSPWQNAYVERFIGSVRRECLDHVIVLTAAGLRRVLNEYVAYYSRTRTHLGLNKDAPVPRPVAPPTAGRVIAIPQVGGLHHRYERPPRSLVPSVASLGLLQAHTCRDRPLHRKSLATQLIAHSGEATRKD